MTAQRILLLNPDGTAEVNGVKVRVVPEEPSVQSCDAMLQAIGRGFDHASQHARGNAVYAAYVRALSAAAIDLSGLPRVPERPAVEPRDTDYDAGVCAGYNSALDAMGVK